MLQAATAKAEELAAPMCIAVVDDGGALKAFIRMDGANLGSVQWAIDKAITAASFGYPIHVGAEALQGSPSLLAAFVKLPAHDTRAGWLPAAVG